MASHKNPAERKLVSLLSIAIILFPSTAYAQFSWTGNMAYALIMLLPVVFARTVAPTAHKKKVSVIGIALVGLCSFIVSMEIGSAVFYLVTSLPLTLILVAVFLRRSHRDKNLHIEDIR